MGVVAAPSNTAAHTLRHIPVSLARPESIIRIDTIAAIKSH
jgi:hypothetical protein